MPTIGSFQLRRGESASKDMSEILPVELLVDAWDGERPEGEMLLW